MNKQDMEQYLEVLLALSGKLDREDVCHEICHEDEETAQPCVL